VFDVGAIFGGEEAFDSGGFGCPFDAGQLSAWEYMRGGEFTVQFELKWHLFQRPI
jgi:hypothetical protein